MKATVADCELVVASIDAFAEGALNADDYAAIDGHLLTCPACRERVKRYRAVKGALEFVDRQERRTNMALSLPAGAPPPPSPWQARLGRAPWWFVSLALHVLVITLASLLTMAIELPHSDDGVTMITELASRPDVKSDEADKPKEAESALDSKPETPPTDPTSKEASDIVVPPDILAKAELGDHFETINLDRPDTHSAFGNEDARSFHSVTGSADKPGGGGTGGVSMEDVIGVGGAGSKGSGGGFGGGDGTGVGAGHGAGTGSFGSRLGEGRKLMVKRHGGSAATENAVDKALHWLAYHQEADGHWDYKKYSFKNPLRDRSDECALTGLATLAFLGAGNTSKIGKYKDNVLRALTWLKSQQTASGFFGQSVGEANELGHYNYGLGMCTMAMAEAYGMTRDDRWKESAENGIRRIMEIQTPYGGWRYGKANNDADVSMVAWMIMALKSAKIAGLKVDTLAFQSALEFVNKCTKSEGMGTDALTEVIYRPQEAISGGFEDATYSTTAIGTLIRLYCGIKPGDDKVGGAFNHLNKELPQWKFGHIHFYYWYYGTLAAFQGGGDFWDKWNQALKQALCESQVKGGDNDGSWDGLSDYYGNYFGGRVYTTALGALSLEVYYRYQKINQ